MNVGINITTADISRIYQQKLQELSNSVLRDNLLKKQNDILRIEEEIVHSNTSCPLPKLKELQEKNVNMDLNEMLKTMQEKFYNPEVLKLASCFTESIVYPQPINNLSLEYNRRLRQWITNLKRIGSGSAEGFATTATVGETNDFFLIKFPQEYNNRSLIHEHFIGTRGTNLMRTEGILSFAYILGGSSCSNAIINDKTKEVEAWCNQTKPAINMVIYEQIKPIISFGDYIKDMSAEEFLNYYLQILYDLKKANNLIGFTHYDLHVENVVFRILNKTVAIPRNTNGRIEYFICKMLPTIIDYGTSRIEYENKSYGVYDLYHVGVNGDKAYPLHDAYKLFMFSMKTAVQNNNKAVFEVGEEIFTFFNKEESLKLAIGPQFDQRYSLPYDDRLASIDLSNLINFIRTKYPNITSISNVPGSYEILGCSGDQLCLTMDATAINVGITGVIRPSTFYQLYDLIVKLNAQKEENKIKEILNYFPYAQAYQDFMNDYTEHVNKLSKLYENFSIFRLDKTSIDVIFNRQFLEKYKSYIMKLVEIYDLTEMIITMKDAGVYVAKIYNQIQIIEVLEKNHEYIKKLFEKYTKAIDQVLNDQKYLESIKTNSQVTNILNRNLSFRWYYSELKNFDSMLGLKI